MEDIVIAHKNNILKEQAEERSKIYNNLSLEQKLKLIKSRRGESKKEEERILKQIKENQ
jgi:hypothetical protein|tara:strand:+ start:38 stop:214 length:177 start_codon:yes stop_codon:yes gene_type:complete